MHAHPTLTYATREYSHMIAHDTKSGGHHSPLRYYTKKLGCSRVLAARSLQDTQ